MVLRTEFDKVYREHRDGTYTPKKRESKSGQQVQKEPLQFPMATTRRNRLQSHIR